MTQRYFLTVDWCNKGNRGVLSDDTGNSFAKDGEPHTYDEIWEILDMFLMVLAPESIPLTEDELKEYNRFFPLDEYSGKYGIVRKGESDG